MKKVQSIIGHTSLCLAFASTNYLARALQTTTSDHIQTPYAERKEGPKDSFKNKNQFQKYASMIDTEMTFESKEFVNQGWTDMFSEYVF